jgi:pilus assembly protein CpaB
MKQKNIVLMVVAVGCGLVAAFLTSQMSAKTPIEKVEVIVAAKDLPVGSQLTKEDLKTAIKKKLISKDSMPPTIIETEEELLDKRLTRTVRMDEMINKGDVTKGGVVSIPPGMNMVTLPINLGNAVAGFVGPGSKVDVLASLRLENHLIALPILVDMLVLAVDGNVATAKEGVYQTLSMVSFAVDRKQALLIKLAQGRNCDISLLLRNPDDKDIEKGYDIDKVIKLLQDNKNPAKLVDEDKVKPEPKSDVAPSPASKNEMVKVPAAAEPIPAGTTITADLIAEKFKLIELPKDVAADAVTDLAPLAGDKQVLRTGLGKGQWVTKSLFGNAVPKPGPREEFTPDKSAPTETKPVEVRKTRDIAVHTTSGTQYYRYEETSEGGWKLLGKVLPNQKPVEKKAEPTPEKVD